MLVNHLPLALFVFLQYDRYPRLVVDRGTTEAIVINYHASNFKQKSSKCNIAHYLSVQVFNLEIIVGEASKMQLFKHECSSKITSIVGWRVAKFRKARIKKFLYLFYLFALGEVKIFVNKVPYLNGFSR